MASSGVSKCTQYNTDVRYVSHFSIVGFLAEPLWYCTWPYYIEGDSNHPTHTCWKRLKLFYVPSTEWRAAMWRCSTWWARRSTSCTCTTRVYSPSNLPTLESGSSRLAKTTYSMLGEHRMERVYSRWVEGEVQIVMCITKTTWINFSIATMYMSLP